MSAAVGGAVSCGKKNDSRFESGCPKMAGHRPKLACAGDILIDLYILIFSEELSCHLIMKC